MNTPKDIPLFQFAVDFEQSKCLQTGCTFDSKPFDRFGIECTVTILIQVDENELPFMGAILAIKTKEDISYDVEFNLINFAPLGDDCFLEVDGIKKEVMTTEGMCFTNTMTTLNIVGCDELVERLDNDQNWVYNDHIRFSVKVSNINPVPCSVNSSALTPQNWTDQFHTMLFDENTSDIAILIGDVRIPCHKLILSLASPVFKAMFENQMQESVSNEIVISDFSEEVMRSFLKCIYDESAVKNEFSENGQQLLLFTNKYHVLHLSEQIREYIIDNITVANVIDILRFAQQFEETEIKDTAMLIMGENAAIFLKKTDFAELLGSMLLTEFHVFLAESCSLELVTKKARISEE